MLNRKEFFDYVKDHVKDYLPPSFENAEVGIENVVKNNDMVLHALIIRKEEESIVANIYLDSFYRSYRQGDKSLESCVGDAADMRIEYDTPIIPISIADVKHYDSIKDKLQVHICDPELNQKRLEGLACTQHGDFVAYYKIVLMEDQEGTASLSVKEDMLKDWGITLEQLHKDAQAADMKRGPVLNSLEDIVEQMIYGNSEPDNLLESGNDISEMFHPMFCLTNEKRMDGASLILQEDLMKQIGDYIGSDFYVLPSSLHETLIAPCDIEMDVQQLIDMVRGVNETQVEQEDLFSDKVQFYDRKTGVLENAEKAMMHKEVEKEAMIAKFTPRSGIHGKLDQAKAEIQMGKPTEKMANTKSMEAVI